MRAAARHDGRRGPRRLKPGSRRRHSSSSRIVGREPSVPACRCFSASPTPPLPGRTPWSESRPRSLPVGAERGPTPGHHPRPQDPNGEGMKPRPDALVPVRTPSGSPLAIPEGGRPVPPRSSRPGHAQSLSVVAAEPRRAALAAAPRTTSWFSNRCARAISHPLPPPPHWCRPSAGCLHRPTVNEVPGSGTELAYTHLQCHHQALNPSFPAGSGGWSGLDRRERPQTPRVNGGETSCSLWNEDWR